MASLTLDDRDSFILIKIHADNLEDTEKDLTTGDIAKDLFRDCEDEIRDSYDGNKNRFLTAKTNMVKHRVKKMEEHGLLAIEKTKTSDRLKLDDKKVVIRTMKTPDKKMGKFLCVKDLDDKWLALQI